jgi:GNAT superfamily N-acetyltransferase
MLDEDYEIRLAQPGEVSLLPAIELAAARLFADTDLGIDHATLESTAPVEAHAAAQRAGMLWVAVAPSGEPVGFAYGRMLGDEPHLEELDVHPGHGRRGLGAKLVRALIEWARAHGATGVTLSTFRDIAWNAPFYARMGFRALAADELDDDERELIALEARKGLPVERRVVMRLGLRG